MMQESIGAVFQVHDMWATTPIFYEEMDKLKPWFGQGTSAYYVTFDRTHTALCMDLSWIIHHPTK